MKLIRWSSVIQPAEEWHFTRAICRPNAPIIMHYHDFAEVFWIEEGHGSHCLNGERTNLEVGTLIFIRPQDRHEFRSGREGAAFTVANFALPAATAASCRERWRNCGVTRLPWGDRTVEWRLSSSQLATLHGIVRSTMDGPSTALAGDRFLSSLMHELHREPSVLPVSSDAPEWLFRAVVLLRDPAHLRMGLNGFFAAAGRTRAHVARVCQKHLQLTPTELVNRCRLDHAARLLERTDMTILEIGVDSGFTNLSLFHRRFRKMFGDSPLQYRRQRRRSLPSGWTP